MWQKARGGRQYMNAKKIIGWSILAILLIGSIVNIIIKEGWSGALTAIIIVAFTGLVRLAIKLIESK